jgi:hypothetical protein
MAFLPNSTFENGAAGWRPNNFANVVNMNVVQNGTAQSGNAFLHVRSAVQGGSVAIDVSLPSQGGPHPGAVLSGPWTPPVPSLGVFAWVRASPGSGPVSAVLTIWNLTGQPQVHPDTKFTALDGNWVLITNAIDLPIQNGPLTTIRVEFYINTFGGQLDIDSVVLV